MINETKVQAFMDSMDIYPFNVEPEVLLVKVDETAKTIDVLCPAYGYTESSPYAIAFDRIQTPEKVLGWLLQLSAKRWFTVEHARQLIFSAQQIGVKVDRCL